MISNAVT